MRVALSIVIPTSHLAQLRCVSGEEDFNFSNMTNSSLSTPKPAEIRRSRCATRRIGYVACVALDKIWRPLTGPKVQRARPDSSSRRRPGPSLVKKRRRFAESSVAVWVPAFAGMTGWVGFGVCRCDPRPSTSVNPLRGLTCPAPLGRGAA